MYRNRALHKTFIPHQHKARGRRIGNNVSIKQISPSDFTRFGVGRCRVWKSAPSQRSSGRISVAECPMDAAAWRYQA
jgi:hypothetical protein